MAQITYGDLLSQEALRKPSAFYGQLREQEPLSHLTFSGLGFWIIATTYNEAIELLKDPRFIKDMGNMFPEGGSPQQQQYYKMIQLMSRNMLAADPPDHTRLRNLVSKAFTPRMIEQLRPRIQQITDELLDAVQQQGVMDLVVDFAIPLPITVISEMLGIPSQDRTQFRGWTQTLMTAAAAPGQEATFVTAGEKFFDYIRTLLATKREHPSTDLTSNLIQVEEHGDTLSEDELMSMIWLLIVAGHETTVNLISNGVLELLLHPEQMHLLQHDSSLLPSAIEELLRYTVPVVFAGARFANEDIPLHGKVIRKGEMMRISLAAANTDPQQFTNPDVLDITRQVNKHLAFGRGIHVCLGAPLARLEGQIAIGTLLQRLPHLRLASGPEQLTWSRIPNLRGLTSLPVTF